MSTSSDNTTASDGAIPAPLPRTTRNRWSGLPAQADSGDDDNSDKQRVRTADTPDLAALRLAVAAMLVPASSDSAANAAYIATLYSDTELKAFVLARMDTPGYLPGVYEPIYEAWQNGIAALASGHAVHTHRPPQADPLAAMDSAFSAAMGEHFAGDDDATETVLCGSGNDSATLDAGEHAASTGSANGHTDVMHLSGGGMASQLWFRKMGSGLELNTTGSADKAPFANGYAGSAHHIRRIKTSAGLTLFDSQVSHLVNAMAAFAPPLAGQTSLGGSPRSALDLLLASRWH